MGDKRSQMSIYSCIRVSNENNIVFTDVGFHLKSGFTIILCTLIIPLWNGKVKRRTSRGRNEKKDRSRNKSRKT